MQKCDGRIESSLLKKPTASAVAAQVFWPVNRRSKAYSPKHRIAGKKTGHPHKPEENLMENVIHAIFISAASTRVNSQWLLHRKAANKSPLRMTTNDRAVVVAD
jgi:hypothetical protein